MKFLESKPKSAIYTFLIQFLVIAEMGILSGFRFTLQSKYNNGFTADKVADLAQIGSKIGWNFIVVSCLIILGMFGYAMILGYNKNPSGLVTMIVVDFLPLIGLAFTGGFNFFFGYGTAHFLPAMAVFGVHTSSRAAHIAFIVVVAALTAVAWVVGRQIRKAYAKKYEYD